MAQGRRPHSGDRSGRRRYAAFLPFPIDIKKGEHISAYFEPPGLASPLAGVGPADVYDRDPQELPLVSGGAAVIGDGVLATGENGNVVLCQLVPWQFDSKKPMNQKRTFRRSSRLLTRLAANLGAAGSTPILNRFHSPVEASKVENRWLDWSLPDAAGGVGRSVPILSLVTGKARAFRCKSGVWASRPLVGTWLVSAAELLSYGG